jgi:imidazolonepropionase-like amidohydrolase
VTRTVFTGGLVFDGTADCASSADVAVEDGLIVEIGTGIGGDHEIPLGGMGLLPGFFDCHVHMLLSDLDYLGMLNTPLSYRILEAGRNLQTLLETGITTVRDAAGADLGLKRAVRDGIIAGPRMQISVGMICQTGGHNDGWMLSGAAPQILFPVYPGVPDPIADGPEQMRAVVRAMLRSGADVIKIATSGGILSPCDSPQHAHFRDDEIAMAVSEAAAAGVKVMSHAQACDGVKAAVRNGVASIEHGFELDDEAIELMLSRGTYLVPTLAAPYAVIDAGDKGVGLDPTLVAMAEEVIEMHRASIGRAAKAGVKIAMGTDSGISPHGSNLRELALMVDAGMTPAEALRAATATAAELLGVDGELGTIREGKRADLVLVEGDPLAIDSLSERIVAVFQDGRQVVGQPLAAEHSDH